MDPLISYPDGIYAIDAGYVRPRLAAIHLVVEGGRAAFVDTGTSHSLRTVVEVLGRLGLSEEAVDYVIPTHVHLDHAGGAGAMMRAFPNARLVVHPRGAPHLIDPERLIAGTIGVYGEAATRQLYGDIVPVDAGRVIEASDGLEVDLAGRRLVCYDTPGHARHHICIRDGRTGHLFTGDMFGLSYRELDCHGRNYIFPTTTPVQFEPEAMHQSIDRLLNLAPEAVYATHYSQVREIPRLGADLHRLVDLHVEVARREKDAGPRRHERIVAGLREILLAEAERYRWTIGRDDLIEIFAGDLELNAQGLEIWLDRTR